jgi:hypothetical protein
MKKKKYERTGKGSAKGKKENISQLNNDFIINRIFEPYYELEDVQFHQLINDKNYLTETLNQKNRNKKTINKKIK